MCADKTVLDHADITTHTVYVEVYLAILKHIRRDFTYGDLIDKATFRTLRISLHQIPRSRKPKVFA